MRKIGPDVRYAVANLASKSQTARYNLRIQEVRARYKAALESVYHESAALFLEHTNNVYIKGIDGVKTLIVYVDEGIFAAELNAQRELIKLKLLELYGEDVGEFAIHVSRGAYRDNHPYADDCRGEVCDESSHVPPRVPLDADERRFVSDTVSKLDDETLRKSVEKAMTADLEWKKGKRVENNGESENQPF